MRGRRPTATGDETAVSDHQLSGPVLGARGGADRRRLAPDQLGDGARRPLAVGTGGDTDTTGVGGQGQGSSLFQGNGVIKGLFLTESVRQEICLRGFKLVLCNGANSS